MTTRIILGQLANGREYDVVESFDEVMEKCYPTNSMDLSKLPPAAQEDAKIKRARDGCTFKTESGDRVFIQNMNVVAVEENV